MQGEKKSGMVAYGAALIGSQFPSERAFRNQTGPLVLVERDYTHFHGFLPLTSHSIRIRVIHNAPKFTKE